MQQEHDASAAAKKGGTVYDYTAHTLDGKDLSFKNFEGKVLLIVNTASECGFTPQYAELEKLHEEFAPKGLQIVGFPCNQFGHQEPGSSEQIGAFCQRNYGVKFQMMEKVDVNGKAAHPLYEYLKESAPGVLGSEAIKWNFTKFLIDKKGHVVKRYAPSVNPLEIKPDIEAQLAR